MIEIGAKVVPASRGIGEVTEPRYCLEVSQDVAERLLAILEDEASANLEDLTVAQLRNLAKQRGVDVPSKASKKAVLTALA